VDEVIGCAAAACLELQALAGGNAIGVDLDCED
jgi:hypothetical protein